MSANSAQPYAHPAGLIIVLSIAPAIGLGICRFAALNISVAVLAAGVIACMAYAALRDKRGLQGEAGPLQSTPACGNIR
jgi:hypothetical protein